MRKGKISPMTLGHFLRIALRGYRVILATVVAAVLIGIVVLAVQQPSYRATSIVQVKAGLPENASREALNAAAAYAKFRTITYKALVTTGVVLDKVIDELALPDSSDDLAEHVVALSALDTTTIEIIVSWPDAQGAAEVANSIARHAVDQFSESNGVVSISLSQVSKATAAEAPAIPNAALSIGLAVFAALWLSLAGLVTHDRFVSRRTEPLDPK